MDRSTELRLPTIAVPVRLALIGHPTVEAELFLADVPRSGRSQLLDDLATLVDSEADFVPVRADARVQLYAKPAIAWIAVHRHESEPEAEGDGDFEDIPSEVFTLYDRQHRVEVKLVAGGTLIGMLLDSAPADRPRVMDHLNRAGRFVRLWTSDEHYLINKVQILHVAELAWDTE